MVMSEWGNGEKYSVHRETETCGNIGKRYNITSHHSKIEVAEMEFSG